jgi:hypothetical protein
MSTPTYEALRIILNTLVRFHPFLSLFVHALLDSAFVVSY